MPRQAHATDANERGPSGPTGFVGGPHRLFRFRPASRFQRSDVFPERSLPGGDRRIHEDELDEAQFVAWVKQASELPGERM